MQPLSNVTCHWSLLNPNSFHLTIQTIPNPPSGPSVKSMCLQVRDKDAIARIQGDEISSSSLLHTTTPSHKATESLTEAMMDVINHIHFFHVPLHSFQKDLLHDCLAQR